MITTVTINPCVDKTYFVENFREGETNRAKRIMYNAGSKGINVSRALKQLGLDTVCLGFVGGTYGNILLQELNGEGTPEDLVRVKSNIRLNVKIIDTESHQTTEINEVGEPIEEAELQQFMQKYEEYAKKSECVVISGSVLPRMETSIYYQLTQIANRYGAKVYLDSRGPHLREGVKAIPYCVKHNKKEFEELIGKKIDNEDVIVEEARKIIATGVTYVVVTLGGEGSIGVSATEALRVVPPAVGVISTVGAGDTFMAGMLAAEKKGMSFRKQLIFATSCANAKVAKEGNDIPSMIELMGHVDGCIVLDMERSL